MTVFTAPQPFPSWAARTAGLALLIMAVLAPLAIFGVLQPLQNAGADAARLFDVQSGRFRLAIVILLGVAVLDILVAWALYQGLYRDSPALAQLAAWFRLAYAVVLTLALAPLVRLLSDTPVDLAVLDGLTAFNHTYSLGLGLFGVHLAILGLALFHAARLPRVLAGLVVIAGLGYLADTLGALLVPGYSISVAAVTFIGEVVLMGWLLWAGFRRPSRSRQ